MSDEQKPPTPDPAAIIHSMWTDLCTLGADKYRVEEARVQTGHGYATINIGYSYQEIKVTVNTPWETRWSDRIDLSQDPAHVTAKVEDLVREAAFITGLLERPA